MDMDQIDMIGLQALEASFQDAQGVVVLAGIDLCREEKSVSARGHYLPNARFALAAAIAVGGVDVGDAQVESVIQRLNRFVIFLVGEKSAAAAKREDGNSRAGVAQNARRHARFLVYFRCERRLRRQCCGRGCPKKLPSGNAHSMPPFESM